jgi:hypothetical protein
MNFKDAKGFIIGAIVVASGLSALAVSIPNSFGAGTPIKASEMNANFAAFKVAMDALETQVAGLELTRATGLRIKASTLNGCTLIDNAFFNQRPDLVLSVGVSPIGTGAVKSAGPYYFDKNNATVQNKWAICTNDNTIQTTQVEYHVVAANNTFSR